MTYSQIGLIVALKEFKKKVQNNLFFAFVMAGLGLAAMSVVGGRPFELSFFISSLIFLVVMSYFSYMRIIPQLNQINNTAITVTFGIENLSVETAELDVLFFMSKTSKTVTLRKSGIQKKLVKYPIQTGFGAGQLAWRLADGEKEVYILNDYFPNDLQQKIQDF